MNIKKILSILLLSICSAFIIGCELPIQIKVKSTDSSNQTTTIVSNNKSYILPDLDNKTTEEVIEYFKNSDVTNYVIKVKNDLTYGKGDGLYEYGKFYGYAGDNVVKGSEFKYSKKLTVYVTAYELSKTLDEFIEKNPDLKDSYKKVTLNNKTYTGVSFIQTGCGEVEVVSYVDGDTTRFKDKTGETISLRYLGVDTPESTAAFEPWGKAASAYTENCLKNAKKVVLEADEPGQKDSNERYLGWVWYQDSNDEWHLLNLELITFCYTKDKASSDSTYGDLCTSVGTIVGQTGRRVWGEHDPNYDYSTDPKEITIQELKTNFASYYARKVKITGVIALVDGQSAVIIDPDTNYGVYFYIPSWYAKDAYNVVQGNKVTIIGTATYYGSVDDADLDNMDEDLGNGSPQLTDFKEKNITVISENNVIEPVEMTIDEIDRESLGMYVTFKNLTITKVKEASTGSGFTIYCKDSSNNELSIRVDNSHYDTLQPSMFKAGDSISTVTGYLAYYYGFQLTIVSSDYITIK